MIIFTTILTALSGVVGWISFIYNMIPSPIRKILSWVILGLLIFFAFMAYVKIKENEARQQALLDFNQQQVIIEKQQNEQYKTEIDQLNKEKVVLDKQLKELNDKLDIMQNKVIVYINKYKDVKLDPIFNDVLNQMHKYYNPLKK